MILVILTAPGAISGAVFVGIVVFQKFLKKLLTKKWERSNITFAVAKTQLTRAYRNLHLWLDVFEKMKKVLDRF